MNPGEFGLSKQDRKSLTLRGLHQAHRGIQRPCNRGSKLSKLDLKKTSSRPSFRTRYRIEYSTQYGGRFIVEIYCFFFTLHIRGRYGYRPSSWRLKVSLFRISSIYQSQNGMDFTMLVFHFYILHIIFAVGPSMDCWLFCTLEKLLSHRSVLDTLLRRQITHQSQFEAEYGLMAPVSATS